MLVGLNCHVISSLKGYGRGAYSRWASMEAVRSGAGQQKSENNRERACSQAKGGAYSKGCIRGNMAL